MNQSVFESLQSKIKDENPDRVFIVTDSNVVDIERELISHIPHDGLMVIPAGEENKTLQEMARVVGMLSGRGATRRSMLVCVGGGMVTDLGGFAAAVFKRGIRHMNVPTTLLGAVDASVGGKTGVDFNGLKNEVGAFHMPVAVIPDAESFASLPAEEVLSGFGEVMKTAMLADKEMTHRLETVDPLTFTPDELEEICRFCREVKTTVVNADPKETGRRKILNLGHTMGHAFESLMMEKGCPVPHGVAVAHGLLMTLLLSNMLTGLPSADVSRYAGWLRKYYPALPFTCKDYERIWQLARHDKKNYGIPENSLSFVLLSAPGNPMIDVPVTRQSFEVALDLYQELQGR